MERKTNFLKSWLVNLAQTTLSVIVIFCLLILGCRFFGYRVKLRETIKQQAERFGVAVEDLGKEPAEGLTEELEKIKSRAKVTLEELKKIKSGIYLTQEYPSSQGYNYQQSIDLRTKPAVVNWQENEQPFWLGIANIRIKENYKNPILFLNFAGKVNVRVDPKNSIGWLETDPDFTYFIKLNGDLQPLVTYRLNPLFVKFPNEGDYSVHFGIRGDNELPIDGDFIIKVKK